MDNYKKELKKGKWKSSDAVTTRTISPWESQTEQLAGMQWCVSQNSGAGFEGGLNKICDPTLYPRRGDYQDSFLSTFQQQLQALMHN
jgi:hypothetical protein